MLHSLFCMQIKQAFKGTLSGLPSCRIGTANGVPFYERPPDALREEDLVTTDAAPQPESVARLWDGRSSDADGGGRAHVGSASRSRDDRDYSDGGCHLFACFTRFRACYSCSCC
jgi:hypothetical protein